MRLLDRLFDFDEIRVHSRRPESRDAFAERLSRDLGKPVVATADWESCVAAPTSSSRPRGSSSRSRCSGPTGSSAGALVVPYGTMSAVELSLTDIMDKLVVDDWGQASAGPFGALRRARRLRASSRAATLHAELGEIVAGRKPGRERDDETILLWHRGLSLSDIALGAAMLEKAKGLGVGTKLRIRMNLTRQ